MSRKLTKQELIERFQNKHGNFYDYSLMIYKGTSKKIKIICPKHGEFEQFPKDHENGRGCKKCAYESSTKKNSLTQKEFINKCKKIHNNKYDYSLVKYVNSNSMIDIICPVHGIFTQKAIGHSRGRGCRKCSYENRHKNNSLDNQFESFCSKLHDNKYKYFNDYKSLKSKIKIQCPIHGVFFQLAENHYNGSGCPECHYDNLKLPIEEYIKKSNKIHNKYDYSLSKYEYVSDKIIIICPDHGPFELIASHHTSYKRGCPKCNVSFFSKFEEKIKEFLEDNNINYQRNKLIKDINENTKNLKQSLDFYIPSHSIAIEINGIFWHGELSGKDNKYHLNKTNICEKKNIQLIHIFGTEFQNWEIVKSRLSHILKISNKKIYARKCYIKELPSKESNTFLKENHIQGRCNSKYRFGLFYDNELLSVMTFGKKRKCFNSSPKENEYELIRFCNKNGYHIIGAAGKLLKHFEKEFNPSKITTFADRRWTTNRGFYEKIGFEFKHISKPCYWYFIRTNHCDNGKLHHRYKFAKHNLPKLLKVFDPNLTEWQNMQNNGYDRIWDCGNFVFEKYY